MKHTFYVILNVSLDKDKTTQNIIAKYAGNKFLAALPLPKFAKIDYDIFKKAPKMLKNKNMEFVLTRQDLNKDGIKDIIVSIFYKNKYIISVPFDMSSGGNITKFDEENNNKSEDKKIKDDVKDQTNSFHYDLGNATADNIFSYVINKMQEAF